jgi:hypothetical protein
MASDPHRIETLLWRLNMKLRFLAPVLMLSLAGPAFSGGMIQPVVEPVVVVDPAVPSMSSANGLIIPLIIVALIALAANNSSDSNSPGGPVAESDMRLKTDILRIGTAPSGLGIYQFKYLTDDVLYQGAMAQEVLAINPAAVIMNPAGYMSVDYSMIDVQFQRVN